MRLLEHLRNLQNEVSVCSQLFEEKIVHWLSLNCDVRVVRENETAEKFPTGVWALTGAGKTARLRNFRGKFPDAREISANALIRGELGETQRRLHAAFAGNLSEKFPIVLWDDADLTLCTEGRIVKEVISDLLRLLQDFRGLFVFTADDRRSLPLSLAEKVDKWNPESIDFSSYFCCVFATFRSSPASAQTFPRTR